MENKQWEEISVLQVWTQARELLNAGFTVEESVRLIQLREQVLTGKRARTRRAEDNRLAFLKWLVDHGKVSEW